jgi:CSLREA domain-containing protein
MKRVLCCFLACLAAVFIGIFEFSQPAFADHGAHNERFLQWDEGGDTQVAVFGPNEAVTIYQGAIDFIDECPSGGIDDELWPWADVYVVPAGSVRDGVELQDRTDRHNSVRGTTPGGLFIDETIGFTMPDGKIGIGKYAVVYDECQDGRFDEVYDKVFDPAFSVDMPDDLPPLPPSSIAEIKADAAAQKQHWQIMHGTYWLLFNAADTMKVLGKVWSCGGWWALAYRPLQGGNPYGGVDCGQLPGKTDLSHPYSKDFTRTSNFLSGITKGVELFTGIKPKDMALQHITNTANHYAGIAADPPDPEFRQLTPLEAREVIDSKSGDHLDVAVAEVGMAASSQQRLLEALLHSLERYQGAVAEDDENWALVHARAVRDYTDALTEQLPVTNAALSGVDGVLSAYPRPLEDAATGWEVFRSRVASEGFTTDEFRDLRNLGLTSAEIADLKAEAIATDLSEFTNGDVGLQHQSVRDANATLAADLATFSTDMDEIIAALEADPNVSDTTPVADAGGPYSGDEGESIAFSGSATGKNSIEKYEWDLDGDGQFDDATGATPTHTYDRAFHGFVGLRITDTAGLANVAYAPVSIRDVNSPPRITEVYPFEVAGSVVTGSTQQFGVTASDPDGDTISIQWYVDDTAMSDSDVFEYTPDDTDVGFHDVRVVVADDDPRGGAISMSWATFVTEPDADGDGYRANVDCNDFDPDVNPGKTEVIGNDTDDDCNGTTLDRPDVAVVTTTEDTNDGACDSDCSLREAIAHANSHPNGVEPDKITFNIPGEGVKRISPTSALPTIADPVIIDGYTQPGASENTKAVGNDAVLKIELNGSQAGYGADGLTITAGDSTVRGLVINGFSTKFVARGILIKTKGNNVIEGNRIGTNAAGTDSNPTLANYIGLLIQNVPNNTIGGTTPGARNLITSNESYNVRIEGSGASGNKIQGNYIGTNADGSAPIYKGFDATNSNFGFSYAYYGVAIVEAPDSIIGGTEPGAGNVVSGNKFHNVLINGASATGARVQGNYIGTDATGTVDLQNPSQGYNVNRPTSGVEVEHAPNTLVGGTLSAARNIISGNADGLVLDGGLGRVHGTQVQGNYIGTDVTGTKDLGNAVLSVYVYNSTNNTIGGTEPGARNVISGGGHPGSGHGDGVVIGEPNSRGNKVQGNYIGTDATGTKDLGSNNHGVVIRDGANNNFVGGTEPGAGNVISGNNLDGVYIEHGTRNATVFDGNRVEGNYIGTDKNGTADLGNGKNGVVLVDGSPNNIIGGTEEAAGNTIAFNESGGVEVANNSTTKANSILANSIFSNGGLGIDLDPNGTALVRDRGDDVTLNDDDDSDNGPNNYQNFPELISAKSGTPGTKVEGTLNSTPNTTFTVQFFYGPEKNPSGYGEGRTYLNEKTDVTTDANGDASFTFDTTTVVPVGQVMTATATGPGDGTSEFSKAVTVESANTAPIARDQGISIDENTEKLITLSAADADNDHLTYKIAALPTNGKLYDGNSTAESDKITSVGATLSGSEVTYVPDENFSGDSFFKFLVNDGTENSNEATVSISVTAVNDAPTVVLTGPSTANEGDSVNYSFTVNDPDSGDTFAPRSGSPDCGTEGALVNGSLNTAASGGSFDCRFPDGPASTGVKIQVTDGQGTDSNVATKNVTVANVTPTANFEFPAAAIDEGGSFNLSLTTPSDPSSVDTSVGFTYAFDCGSGYGAFSSNASASCPTNDSDQRAVKAKIRDKDGDEREYTGTATINNVAPTADFNFPTTEVKEGGSFALSLTGASDVSSADQAAGFEYALNCGSGYGAFTNNTGLNCSTDDGPGTLSVKAQVRDKDGGVREYTGSVSVTNVAPTITGITSTSQNALVGTANSVTFTGTVTDPSLADTNYGFKWQWALDGDAYTTFGQPSVNTFKTSFTSCGAHTVSARAADKDTQYDGISAPFTTNYYVNAYNGAYKAPLVDGTVNKVQKGQVVPVKISIGCGNTNLTGLSPRIDLLSGDVSPQTESGSTAVTTSVSSADTGQIMRPVDGGYIYNLQVPSNAAATQQFTIRVNPWGVQPNAAAWAASSMYIVIEIRK